MLKPFFNERQLFAQIIQKCKKNIDIKKVVKNNRIQLFIFIEVIQVQPYGLGDCGFPFEVFSYISSNDIQTSISIDIFCHKRWSLRRQFFSINTRCFCLRFRISNCLHFLCVWSKYGLLFLIGPEHFKRIDSRIWRNTKIYSLCRSRLESFCCLQFLEEVLPFAIGNNSTAFCSVVRCIIKLYFKTSLI